MADAKKLVGGLGKIKEQLLAPSNKVTAAERAEAGRKAAALIQSQPQVKASEALGQLMEKGFKKTTTTQADRTRVGKGNIGGAPFSAISEVDPNYADKVWGVFDEGTASRLTNLTSPDTAWTTMLGSANQLKTNPIVFDKLKRGFVDSMKQGNLSDELAGKINHNLALTFGEGADIRDPKIWKQADTFEKRAALADLMMGLGIAPSKGGVSLGGEKSGRGVIFRPSDILKRETEPYLLHTEHGGDVPTFAAGPRLFRLDKETEFRPDLHPGFPTLIKGKDLEYNMAPTPTEIYLPTWHADFKKNNPDRKAPGYYDLALGVKGEGLPSQELNDEYIKHLLREGFKEGGSVDIDAADARLAAAIEKRMAKGGSVDIKAADARLEAAINARMGMAEGGATGFKKIEFMADGGKLVKGLSNIGKKLFADSKVLPQAEREANLQKFLAPSAEKRRMYHGTKDPNITEFRTRKDMADEAGFSDHYADERDAVFLSPDPDFTKNFSIMGYTEEGMAPTTYPVYAQIERPFDFDNPEHLKKVKDTYRDMFHNPESEFYDPHMLGSERSMEILTFDKRVDDLPTDENNWMRIENPKFQDVLKDLGFDSFYTRERGTKNLGIYDPNRIKSATGNQGTYDLGESDINKAEGGGAFKKLEFMADGGKIVKGAKKFLKKLMANDVLPEAERQANKEKFLSPSRYKERLYHATPSDFKEFKLGGNDPMISGEAIWLSSDPTFQPAAHNIGDPRMPNFGVQVMPVHAQVTNPMVLDDKDMLGWAQDVYAGGSREFPELLPKRWADEVRKDYDSIIFADPWGRGDPHEIIMFEPEKIKSAIGNRGTYDTKEKDITKADGGKIVGGLGKIAKKLMAENTLPTAEREANLQKFLEPSKTPMRLYHGTTATEGGKGNEAIRRIKPSKEGALGSGVYLTPKTAHASGYSNIPNDEAIDAMLASKYYQDTGLNALTQRKTGELLPEQEGGNMLPVHAQLRNPLIIGQTGRNIDPAAEALIKLGMDEESAMRLVERAYEEKGNIGKQIQSRAQSQGYDGIMQYRGDDLNEVVSYRPNAVKSAIGNRGTYDINEPDLSKSDGGKIVKGLSKVAKKLLEEPRIQTIEAPSIIIPSKLSNVKEMARKREGEYGARRVERASDEIPNLEKMYQEDALRRAFIGGDNARALMTMNPADFENYAAPLDLKTSIGPKMAEYAKQGDITKDTVPTDEFIKYLRSLQDGFEDIPMLTINKEESGLPLVPFITGHEGRHRSRALAESEQPTSLIQLYPRAELREPFPRRSQEEYIDAIRKEMEMTGNMVRPEVYLHNILEKNVKRDPIKLPDLYADGGAAFKTLQFKDAQHFDGGGIAFPEMTPMTEGSRREPLLTEKDWENIKRNAPEVYEWAKQNVKDEASQLKSARGVKDFALRTGAQYLGGIPDLLNLGLMGVDALADTNLSSEKPYFGSERYIDAMRKAGMVGENEFPIAETVAGVLMPAGLIKKGIKKISGAKPAKQEPKKRQGGLSAMAR